MGAWERDGDAFSGGGTPQKSPGWARGLRPHHRCVPLMTVSCGTGQKPQRCASMDQILGFREARQLPRASSRVTVWRSDFHEGALAVCGGGLPPPLCCPLKLHGSLSLSLTPSHPSPWRWRRVDQPWAPPLLSLPDCGSLRTGWRPWGPQPCPGSAPLNEPSHLLQGWSRCTSPGLGNYDPPKSPSASQTQGLRPPAPGAPGVHPQPPTIPVCYSPAPPCSPHPQRLCLELNKCAFGFSPCSVCVFSSVGTKPGRGQS